MQKMKADANGVYPYKSIQDAVMKVRLMSNVICLDCRQGRCHWTLGRVPNLFRENCSSCHHHSDRPGLPDRKGKEDERPN